MQTSVPVLLLSGDVDLVTPPALGEEAKSMIGASATHLVVPHAGHSTISQPCVRDIVAAFIISGGAPPDSSCLAAIPPIPW